MCPEVWAGGLPGQNQLQHRVGPQLGEGPPANEAGPPSRVPAQRVREEQEQDIRDQFCKIVSNDALMHGAWALDSYLCFSKAFLWDLREACGLDERL